MVLLTNNKITEDMITITGGTVALGKERLLSNTPSEICQADSIVIDFVVAKTVDSIGIAGLTSSNDILVEGNDTDDWGAPGFSATLSELSGSNCRVHLENTPVSYRYWRFTVQGVVTESYNVGDVGQAGGWIYAVPSGNGNGYYYESSPSTYTGAFAPDTVLIGSNGQVIGDGVQNTQTWIGHYGAGSTYIPQIFDSMTVGGYSDWFVPSIGSLIEINSTIKENYPYTSFTDYTSSSEYSTIGTYSLKWSDGSQQGSLKTSTSLEWIATRRFYIENLLKFYLGYIYLGERLELPPRLPTSLQKINRFDSLTKGVGGVTTYKTGYSSKFLEATFDTATDAELKTVADYWNTYGAEHCIVVPYEENITESIYAPFYCNPTFEINNRTSYGSNNISATFTEAK